MEMGNFGFPNMNFGFNNTASADDSDSDSSSDSASDIYHGDSDLDVSSSSEEESDSSCDNTLDATYDSVMKAPKKYHSCFEICTEDVTEIETSLDFYELVSLIFLLFDDTNYATQVVRLLIEAGPEHFARGKLSEWARSSPKNWKYKLFEALAIIQNHKILTNFGLSKNDISVMRIAPVYINRLKKILFSSVCDFLNKEQAHYLINLVRCDAQFNDYITLRCDPMYMEFYVLFWISQDYISIEKEPYLEKLTNHLKNKKLLDAYEKVSEEMASWKKETSKLNEPMIMHGIKGDEEEDCYEIKNPKNPGLLLIINNANFKKNIELRNKFKDRLPSPPLDDRHGSEKDVEHLEETFKSLNYKVVVMHDVAHDQLVHDVNQAVMTHFQVYCHSILVLCVLSHGDRGKIYGANSIPLTEEEIINSVSGTSRLIGLLADIPKVIIIQACQGNKVLYEKPEPDLLVPDGGLPCMPATIDGNNTKTDSLEENDPRDRIVCMATIEGFAALRSLTNGTPYIQELCRCIEKYHAKKHFSDIMTIVHKRLNSEKRIVKQIHKKRHVCMIPEIKHNTLRKSLYLTLKK